MHRAVTPLKPFEVKYFTRPASMCWSTVGLVALYLPEGGRPIVPTPPVCDIAPELVLEPEATWTTRSAPVVGLTEIVSTAELVWPELLVPLTLHDAVVVLTPAHLTVTLVKPLDVKNFTRPASMC